MDHVTVKDGKARALPHRSAPGLPCLRGGAVLQHAAQFATKQRKTVDGAPIIRADDASQGHHGSTIRVCDGTPAAGTRESERPAPVNPRAGRSKRSARDRKEEPAEATIRTPLEVKTGAAAHQVPLVTLDYPATQLRAAKTA